MDLDLRLTDLSVLLFTYAVALSGALSIDLFGVEDRTGMLIAALPIALFWTIYFRFSMEQRFRPSEEEEADAETGAGGR